MNAQQLILISNSVLGLVINLVLLAIAQRYPAPLRQSQRVWAMAGLGVSLSWILLSLSEQPMDLRLMLISYALLGWALAEYSRALAVFSGRRQTRWYSTATALIFLLLIPAFSLFWPTSAFGASVMNMLAGALLLKIYRDARMTRASAPLASHILAILTAVLALLYVLRSFQHIGASGVADGTLRLLSGSALTAGFALLGFAFSILCNERLNTQMNRLIRYDSLTGALNRGPWRTDVEQLAQSQPGVIVLFDMDHFKTINDQFGHDAGDTVLQAVATCARTIFGESVGRLGGEEFAVFLPNSNEARAYLVAERFRESVARLVFGSGRNEPLRATVSIGLADLSQFSSVHATLKAADLAMYQAKRRGRNLTVRHSTTQHAQESAVILPFAR